MIDNASIHNFGQVIDLLAVKGSLPNFIKSRKFDAIQENNI